MGIIGRIEQFSEHMGWGLLLVDRVNLMQAH